MRSWRGVAGAALLAAAVLAPSLSGGWLWCDDYTVASNPALRGADALARIATPGEFEQFYPVTHAAYWAWLRLFGESPTAFRALTLALHVAATALVGAIAIRLSLPGAALAAALFGLHPLAVESAAWVYEMKSPLSLALGLGSFLAWLRFDGDAGSSRSRFVSLGVALGLFAAALLAKASAVVLPAFFVLSWAHSRRRPRRDRLAALAAFAILALAMAALTIANEPPLEPGSAPTGWRERCAVAGHAFWFYAGKTLFPIGLSFAYPRLDPESAPLLPAAAAALSLALALFAAASARGPRLRGAGLAILGFAATLAPVLGFFDIYMMRYAFVADHLAYPALAAIAVPAGAALGANRSRLGAAAVIIALFAAVSTSRAITFRSDEALWREAARREPRAWLAQVRLGLALKSQGRIEEAADRFRLALAERESIDALVNLGNLLVASGRAEEALAPLSRAVELAPADAGNHANFALALVALERVDEAIAVYRLALAFAPEEDLLIRNLAALEAVQRGESPPR